MGLFKLDTRGKRVLILSDLHFPWAVQRWFEFLESLHKKNKYDIIISVGDEADLAAISFHEKEPGMPSISKELEMVQDDMQLLATLFPKIYFCDSNHGSLFYRRAKFAGVPYSVLKPMKDLYGTPDYEWHDEIILETNKGDVYICHGKSATYGKLCKDIGLSSVQGHFHTKSEITYHQGISGLKFNMFVGCLADQSALAFQYSKNHSNKFINSVGSIDENGNPSIVLYEANQCF